MYTYTQQSESFSIDDDSIFPGVTFGAGASRASESVGLLSGIGGSPSVGRFSVSSTSNTNTSRILDLGETSGLPSNARRPRVSGLLSSSGVARPLASRSRGTNLLREIRNVLNVEAEGEDAWAFQEPYTLQEITRHRSNLLSRGLSNGDDDEFGAARPTSPLEDRVGGVVVNNAAGLVNGVVGNIPPIQQPCLKKKCLVTHIVPTILPNSGSNYMLEYVGEHLDAYAFIDMPCAVRILSKQVYLLCLLFLDFLIY